MTAIVKIHLEFTAVHGEKQTAYFATRTGRKVLTDRGKMVATFYGAS